MMRNPPQIWNGNLAVKSGGNKVLANTVTVHVATSTKMAA